ncbi:MAG: hypothetical protein WD048_01415 [Chitinophagales bacterium]
MSKQHAIHNEAACDFLLSSKKFNDWVVTTAFYAALHFVQNELFPIKENGKTYKELNLYFAKVMKRKNKRLSKHIATIQLIKTHLPACSPYYRWLYDACMNARYSNYKVSFAKANKAREFLSEIKNNLKK